MAVLCCLDGVQERFATEDAVRVGRLHVDTTGWEEASLDYLNSGGYTLSPLAAQHRIGEVTR